MKTDVLGVKIDDVNMEEALRQTEKWIWNPGPDGSFHRGSRTNGIRRERHYIVTPNPEMIVAAQKDGVFKSILNDADLAIPDGAGLKLSGKVKNTFAGVDFMEELVKLAAEKGFTTSFLGGREGVAKKCAECLKKKYPKLKIVFAVSGGEVGKDGVMKGEGLKLPPADILFVAFGHQKQEKWIALNFDKIPAHVIMGVGGSFDEIAGIVPRTPVWVHKLGLKWLVRLVLQPWRIRRQLALLKYLWFLGFGTTYSGVTGKK